MAVIGIDCREPGQASTYLRRRTCRQTGRAARRQVPSAIPTALDEDADDEQDDDDDDDEENETDEAKDEENEAEELNEPESDDEDADPNVPGIQEAPDSSDSSDSEDSDADEIAGADELDSDEEDLGALDSNNRDPNPNPVLLDQEANAPSPTGLPVDPTVLVGSEPSATGAAQSSQTTAIESPSRQKTGGLPVAAERSVIVLVTVIGTLLIVCLFLWLRRKVSEPKQSSEHSEKGFFSRKERPSAAQTESSRGTLWGGGGLWSRSSRGCTTQAQSQGPAPLLHRDPSADAFISDETSTVRDGRLDHVRRSLLMENDLTNLERVHHQDNSTAGPNPFADPPELVIRNGEIVIRRDSEIMNWQMAVPR